jgi:FtsH-binding integral membrane protein
MADLRNYQARAATAGSRADASIDEGLRAYMLRVYNLMALGLAITGVAALGTVWMATSGAPVASLPNGNVLNQFGVTLYGSPLRWVVMLAPLAMVFFLSFRVDKMSLSAAQTTFWAFAAVMGASLSTIFLRYTGQSITQIFFVTAAMFAALSLYGYTTKKDLSGWGTFLFMGVIGLILAMLVNIWLQSPALYFALSAICVLVFAGLTAYDTQQIKDNYYSIAGDTAALAKGSVMGALNLYLDFLNMFQGMLALFGSRE